MPCMSIVQQTCAASGGQAHLAAADAAQAAFLDEAMVLGRIDPLDEYIGSWG